VNIINHFYKFNSTPEIS